MSPWASDVMVRSVTVVAPVLSMATSPDMATAAATLEPLPTIMLALFNDISPKASHQSSATFKVWPDQEMWSPAVMAASGSTVNAPPDKTNPVPVMSVKVSLPSIKVVALRLLAVTMPMPEILGVPEPVISPVRVKAAMFAGSSVPDIACVPEPDTVRLPDKDTSPELSTVNTSPELDLDILNKASVPPAEVTSKTADGMDVPTPNLLLLSSQYSNEAPPNEPELLYWICPSEPAAAVVALSHTGLAAAPWVLRNWPLVPAPSLTQLEPLK